MCRNKKNQEGSIELVVLGLLAALVVVLAIPLIRSINSDGLTQNMSHNQSN